MAVPYSRTVFGNLPWYSFLIVLGMGIALLIIRSECMRKHLPSDMTVDLGLVCIPAGIIGARIYYVLMRWDLYAQNPLSALYIWEGGLAIYGGVLAGLLGLFLYAKRKKLPFSLVTDVVMPGVLLAQAIGRWGNYFNMEAYGPVLEDARFQFFPVGVLIPENGTQVWHMATFFYESMWSLCSFLILWMQRKRMKHNGDMTCCYFLFYGSGRFIIEQLRQDSLYIGGIRASQYLSLALCLFALCVLLYRALHEDRRRFALALCAAALLCARWFVQGKPLCPVFTGVSAVLLAICMPQKHKLPLAAVLVLLDLGGWLCAVRGVPFSPTFGMALHAVLTSATLCAFPFLFPVLSPKNTKEAPSCQKE